MIMSFLSKQNITHIFGYQNMQNNFIEKRHKMMKYYLTMLQCVLLRDANNNFSQLQSMGR